MTNTCPKCEADLRGAEIPEAVRDEWYGGKTHFSRIIGLEIPGVYDGTLIWVCPDCHHKWPRFESGYRHDKAVELIEAGL